jgi:hypothetical protein
MSLQFEETCHWHPDEKRQPADDKNSHHDAQSDRGPAIIVCFKDCLEEEATTKLFGFLRKYGPRYIPVKRSKQD